MPRLQIDIAKREATEYVDPLVLALPDGEEFTCQPKFSEFALLELAAKADNVEENLFGAAAAFLLFLADILEPESYRRFSSRAKRDKWTAKEMLPMVQEIVSYMSGRPTGLPTDSPAGRSSTTTLSKVVSLSEATVQAG